MKLKKYVRSAVMLTLTLMMAVLAACGGSGSSGSPAAGEGGEGALKAAFITPQKLGDSGPVDLAHKGFEDGAEEFGIETQVIQANKGEFEESVRAMAREGYDLVIALYPDLLDAVERVAPEFPDTNFALIIGESSHPNVTSVNFKEQEGSYLAGMLAAYQSESNQVGFVGGVEDPQILRFYAGFQQGALAVKPDIKINPVYVGGFEDPAKGKELSLLLYNEGSDVIYHAAAKSGLGLFDAAKETGKYAIGVDVNQNDLVPGKVLGSMEIYYDKVIYDLMKQLNDGNIQTGVVWHDLKSEMMGLTVAPADSTGVSEEALQAIEATKQQIIGGEIEISDVPVE